MAHATTPGNLEQWWAADEHAVHSSVFRAIRYWDQHQSHIQTSHLLHARLYGNSALGAAASGYRIQKRNAVRSQHVAFNATKSVCDTITARIAKNKPRPMFLSKGGDWTLQQRAKRLSKFVEGAFYAANAYRKGPHCFLDCAVFGKGFAKVSECDGSIEIDRTFPGEIIVDLEDARYGMPRQLHQRRYISREELISLYPESRAQIHGTRAGGNLNSVWNLTFDRSDMVEVIESWHLPSGKGENDGRHAITIESGTLFVEDWEEDGFPFAMIEWGPALLGFWPIGLVEEGKPIQLEMNKLARRVQEIMHRLAVPWLFVQKGSQINSEALSNKVASIVDYAGATPPIISAHSVVPPEVFAHFDRLYARYFELSGVSQMSATGNKPSGLNSGTALRTYNDVENQRFALKAQAYEDFYMDLTRLVIKAARKAKERGEDLTIMGRDTKGRAIEEIRWSEVELDESAYELQVFPTNFLGETPAGKFERVTELTDRGMVSPDMALTLMEIPDDEAALSMMTAGIEDIKSTIERMLRKGEYFPPEPFQELNIGMPMVKQAYLRGRLNGVPDERLELLRTWLRDAQAIKDQEAAEQAAAAQAAPGGPGMPPPGGMPPGPPGPPPPGLPAGPPAQTG